MLVGVVGLLRYTPRRWSGLGEGVTPSWPCHGSGTPTARLLSRSAVTFTSRGRAACESVDVVARWRAPPLIVVSSRLASRHDRTRSGNAARLVVARIQAPHAFWPSCGLSSHFTRPSRQAGASSTSGRPGRRVDTPWFVPSD